MRKAGPLQLNKLLNQGSLQKLQHRSQELNDINHVAKKLFEQYGLTQVQMANIRNGVMVIEASSAAWANRLKQLRLNLLSELRKQLPSLVSIEISINPNLSTTTLDTNKCDVSKKDTSKHHLSQQSAKHIIELAENAPDGLKEKLLKLAAQAGENSADNK